MVKSRGTTPTSILLKNRKSNFLISPLCHLEDEHLSYKSARKQETSKIYLTKSIVVLKVERPDLIQFFCLYSVAFMP